MDKMDIDKTFENLELSSESEFSGIGHWAVQASIILIFPE